MYRKESFSQRIRQYVQKSEKEDEEQSCGTMSWIAPGSNSSNRRPDKSRLSRSPDQRRTPMDQFGTCRHCRTNRLRQAYKSRRLMRTKATLVRDNPAGLTLATTFFFLSFLVISRVETFITSEGREIRYGL